MTTLPRPRATTFHELVLAQLGQDICNGRYPPGALLPSEPELCERFGYSRIVIREAIKSLVAKGMLEVNRRIGTLVLEPQRWNLFDPGVIAWRAASADFDASMARDLMELRRIIEPPAVRLAAQRASAEERRALRAAYMAMVRAVAGKGDYVEADLAFHTTILAACGNQYLRQMLEAMSAMLKAAFEIVSQKPGGPASSLAMHEAVCLAIERGDGAGGEQAAITLIDSAQRDMEELLPLQRGRRATAARRAAR
ncbi:GntR family transcriptional regulator [Pseudorhodoferax soli]|uniref:GntR family transcriptional regulator n=1 Tax=Pseudorhodoferax soli TaxID=545864 RepID=A0A368Y7R5_9BURK|nr:GntR family transcriptional regulator [Pseudorhodoferax soli]